MLARVEVVVRPDLTDSAARRLVKQVKTADPELSARIRWARLVDVYWLDLPVSRENVMVTVQELFWDPVTQWLFTGNLIPSAAGKSGGMTDLMEYSPIRPGNFWAIEKRYRPGITDPLANEIVHAFELIGRRALPEARVATGKLLLIEGTDLEDRQLGRLARQFFCNERLETWSIFDDIELRKNSRFDQERVRRDIPRAVSGSLSIGSAAVPAAGPGKRATFSSALRTGGRATGSMFFGGAIELGDFSDPQLVALAREQKWDLTQAELRAVQSYFTGPARDDPFRAQAGLQSPTESEMHLLARLWSERVGRPTLQAAIDYSDHSGMPDPAGHAMPRQVEGLFHSMIAGTTEQLPKSWLISVLGAGELISRSSARSGSGMIALDDEHALVAGIDSRQRDVSFDAFAGTQRAMLGVQRDIISQGFGARQIFFTESVLLPPEFQEGATSAASIPVADRRTLDGIRRGTSEATLVTGVPLVNGSMAVAGSLQTPVSEEERGSFCAIFSGGAIMPKRMGDRRCEARGLVPGDRVILVGARTGREGLSDLSMGLGAPVVQMSDPMLHKRLVDLVLALRPLGLHRASLALGRGGLAAGVLDLARFTGGGKFDLGSVPLKQPGLSAAEILLAESSERVLLVVPPERVSQLDQAAKAFELEIADIGLLDDSGRFEVRSGSQTHISLDLMFVLEGAPQNFYSAEWKGRPGSPESADLTFDRDAIAQLLALLGRPSIASKESWIRQMDHEAGGMSVIKPLHTVQVGTRSEQSGPNDGGVLKVLPDSAASLAIGTGIQPRYLDIDAWLTGQMAVDEAVRNVLCSGGEYGRPESILALMTHMHWGIQGPRESGNPTSFGNLLRLCQGVQDAALALGTPIIAHQDEISFESGPVGVGELRGATGMQNSLLVQALSRVPDFKLARTGDFKQAGDFIYLLGSPDRLGLVGSELQAQLRGKVPRLAQMPTAPHPDWELGRLLYGWVGGDFGDRQNRLRSLHDVSDGGVLVAISECLLARGFGAQITIPPDAEPWSFCFGEGFHAFIASCTDADAMPIEDELRANRIPFVRLGSVNSSGRLELRQLDRKLGSVDSVRLRQAWSRSDWLEGTADRS